MNKSITFIACFIFLLFKNTTNGQDLLRVAEDKAGKKDTKAYTVKALDGRNQKILVVPDYTNHILRITCLRDTIRIYDYWGVPPEIRVLNKNFIEIKYAVRGGSGVGLGNMMLLGVSGNKLYEAMHVLRFLTGENIDEQDNYHIKVTLKGNDKKTYKLNVNIHDEIDSKSNSAINYNYSNQTILNFDANRNVFYSIKKDIYDHLTLNSNSGKKSKQEIRGNFPAIILGRFTYYFISDRWYELETAKVLDEF